MTALSFLFLSRTTLGMVNTENSADNEILSLQVTLILTHDSTKCLVSSLHFCQATNFPL